MYKLEQRIANDICYGEKSIFIFISSYAQTDIHVILEELGFWFKIYPGMCTCKWCCCQVRLVKFKINIFLKVCKKYLDYI